MEQCLVLGSGLSGRAAVRLARRIGLAQAMINDPAFLILDEPTSGLDPLGCKEVKDLIMTLKKRGKTVLVTSHLLSDVEDICDRVIILYGGKIRATGTLNELLTVTDANRIVTPALSPEVTRRLMELLRENLQGEQFSIDHPRRTLEEFFLEVIDRAKAESVETAGVVSGGKIADYLSADDRTGAVIESLIAETRPAPKAPEKTEAPKPDAAALAAAEEKRLEELTAEPEKAPVRDEKAEQDEAKRKELEEANEKLKDLL